MDREFPFDENAICDACGKKGAFDIYGDFLCELCLMEPDEIGKEEKE